MPKVSVILTSYNHAKYLRESIESILNQTFSDFELIIGDDASTDESWDIIQSYTDPRIHAYRHETNKMGGIINETVLSGKISSDYIAINHSDDIWEPQKLEKQVAFLDNHPETGAVFTNAMIIGEEGEPFEDKSHFYYSIFDQPNRTRYEWLNYFFYHGNALCHPSVLIRKSVYDKHGLYRYGLIQIGDFDMWVRLCLKYEIYVMPEKLVRFRVRANEANASGDKSETHIRGQFEYLQVINNYKEIASLEELSKIFPEAGKYYNPAGSDLAFALGMVALETKPFKFTELFGLTLIFEAINQPERARLLADLYGFTYKDFVALTLKHDVFSIGLLSKYAELSRQLTGREQELAEIKNSKLWKLALQVRRLAPPNSRRAQALNFFAKILLFPIQKFRQTRKLRAENLQADLALIRSSAMFDAKWYLTNNPDIARIKMDPALHYLYDGGFEGRDPGPNFSSSLYLTIHDDAKKARINPLVHFLRHGGKEEHVSLFTQPPTLQPMDKRPLKIHRPPIRSRSWSVPKWITPKEIARKILVKTNAWLSSRPILRNRIKHLFPPSVRNKLNRTVNANYFTGMELSTALTEWDTYLQLSGIMRTVKQANLNSFVAKKPQMVNLDAKDLIQTARSLKNIREENPEVSIIIPAHNNAQLTLECLVTLEQHTDQIAYEIIIVDDGSDSETMEILQAIPHISLIHNNERIGFSQSCNQGANAARGKYLLFLNNDTQVMKGWLKPLVDVFVKHDRVGAVGSKVLFPDGRLQEAGCLINRDGTAALIGFVDDPDLPRYNFAREVDYSSAVSLIVTADIFHDIGGFDESYSPAYYEDVDLCFKIRARGLKIFYCPDSTIIHHLSATANKIDPSFKLQLVARNRQKFLERWQETLDEIDRVKLIAFYLPQYYPIPENDRWWGKGFTEWANVTRARPNYEGHYQPHLPADLGYYDLRVAEIMEQQVEMAKRYNIYGFCYYYYWFNGKRILEMPLERMLETGKPDFPFCLCWANENWSRRWDGSEDDILLAQNHSEQDDKSVILDLIRYLRHPNYIRVDGKPIILIYRVALFPDIQRTVQIWREACREENLGEIHLVMVESLEHALKGSDPHKYGLDATIEFPPHDMATPYSSGAMINPDFSGHIYNYRNEAIKFVNKKLPGHTHYNNVMPSWDNTARKQNRSDVFDQATPEAYQAWLEAALQRTREQLAGNYRMLFINAWNEWAEGNHLEPDQRYGHRYLEATRNAQESFILKRGS